jgi:glyceraldehyde 3-phosphate dehydrogenase
LPPLLENGDEIAFLNDAVGSPEMHAYLLEFDTVHGRWAANFGWNENTIKVNGLVTV